MTEFTDRDELLEAIEIKYLTSEFKVVKDRKYDWTELVILNETIVGSWDNKVTKGCIWEENKRREFVDHEYDVKEVIGDEGAVYDLFERSDFHEQAMKLKPDNMYVLVYFWYSCDYGMEKEELCCHGMLEQYGPEHVDLFELVWNRDKQEVITLNEEQKDEILDVLAERIRMIRIHVG